jgi:RepB DNA-primase from phage plasmid
MPDGSNINPYQVDLAQLEPFLARVIVVAECYDGNFVAAGFGEAPDTYDKLLSRIHVVPNDSHALSNLIEAFMTINQTPGLNAYLSIGLFKPRDKWRKPRGRGGEDDLIGTLAFVGDFDRGHDPATCRSRLPLAPQFVVETSAGNYQTWLLLDRPYPVGEAKPLFAALTGALGSDHTSSCEHIFRPPGTWNWPTKKKVQPVAEGGHGRSPEPQLARLVTP